MKESLCVIPAVILAGGRGTRLGSLTQETPKPLVKVANSPIIVNQLTELGSAGVRTVVVSTGYKAERLIEELLDGSKFGIDIYYSHEEKPLGRGGGIKKALLEIVKDWKHAIVRNGDNFASDLNYQKLLDFHRDKNALVTVVVAERSAGESLGYGLVEMDDKARIRSFREKPDSIKGASRVLINAGIYIISSEAVHRFPDSGDHERELFPNLALEGSLYGYSIQNWMTVDTLEDLEKAEQNFRLTQFLPVPQAG